MRVLVCDRCKSEMEVNEAHYTIEFAPQNSACGTKLVMSLDLCGYCAGQARTLLTSRSAVVSLPSAGGTTG